VVVARTGSRGAVLRTSEPTRFSSGSDDKVGGFPARSTASGSEQLDRGENASARSLSMARSARGGWRSLAAAFLPPRRRRACLLVRSSRTAARQAGSARRRAIPDARSVMENRRLIRALLDRDRLGQVPRLIDIMAFLGGKLAGEHLQGHGGHQGLQQGRHLRQPDHDIGVPADHVVVFLRQNDGLGTPSSYLLEVGNHFVVKQVTAPRRDYDEYWQLVFDQCDRTMLQLNCGETFSMDVGQLLELQSTFQCHRIANVPADEEHRPLVSELGRELHHWLDLVKYLGNGSRHGGEFLQGIGDLVAVS